jgi:hypothetical protein
MKKARGYFSIYKFAKTQDISLKKAKIMSWPVTCDGEPVYDGKVFSKESLLGFFTSVSLWEVKRKPKRKKTM